MTLFVLQSGCAAQPNFSGSSMETHVDKVLSEQDYNTAMRMAESRNCTRHFKFGRRMGHWVINGETWHTFKIAASDVGTNTWEVWCLETSTSWFHPIHIHLIDFYVLTRHNGYYRTVEPYEQLVPKDTVQLHPGNNVSILAR